MATSARSPRPPRPRSPPPTDVFPRSGILAIVAIGDASKIREALRGYGPLTEMKLTDPRFSP